MSDYGWMRQAQCLNRDPDWWDYDFGPLEPKHRKAIRKCDQCMVRLVCLRTALAENYDTGIWGGMTPQQRQQLQTRLKPRVYKNADAWTVTYQNNEATAGSWDTAISFATTITKGTA
jgi:WhiB family redox-sensing transcriptional regulator